MKVYYNSQIAGTKLGGEKLSTFRIMGEVLPYLNFTTTSDGDEVTTSSIEVSLQSAEETILFLTHSGSRYAVQVESEDDTVALAKQVAPYIRSIWSHLKYTDLGKKLLELVYKKESPF